MQQNKKPAANSISQQAFFMYTVIQQITGINETLLIKR